MVTAINRTRIPELDGLRGLAILLVLVWHLLPGALADAPPLARHLSNSLIRFTWSGVDLFFVLSGFLIGGILLDNRDSPRYFKTFYARRFYRILPLYYAAVVAFILLSRTGLATAEQTSWLFDAPLPVWSYMTFTQNVAMARAGSFGAQWLGPTWSLAIEEQFYLLLPLVVRFTPRRALWVVLAALALAAPATRIYLYLNDPNWAASAYVLMPARMDALMLGVLLALGVRNEAFLAYVTEKRGALRAALAFLCVCVAGLALLHEQISTPRMVLAGYSILALLYATMLLAAVTSREGDWLGRVFRLRALRETGMLAYGIYLMHLPVAGLCSLLLPRAPHALVAAAALAAVFLIAKLSWETFEKPLVRRGHFHSY